MEQIHWMLSLIPDAVLNWFYWAIIAVGLTGTFAGWFGKFIPFYGKYVGILKPVGIVLVVLGVWLRGGYDTEMEWRAKVEALEAKVKVAEKQSADANTALSTKTKEKIKVVHDVQVVIKERIKTVETKIDADCKVDPEAISIINDAAKNQVGTKK
jgi:hypothetical protein